MNVRASTKLLPSAQPRLTYLRTDLVLCSRAKSTWSSTSWNISEKMADDGSLFATDATRT